MFYTKSKPHLKISIRFFIVMVITAIIPMIIVSLVLRNQLDNYVYQEITFKLVESAKNNQDAINDIANQMLNISMALRRDKLFAESLSRENVDVYYVNSHFNNFMESVDNLTLSEIKNIDVTFVDYQLNTYTSWNDNTGFANREYIPEWIREANELHGGIVWKLFTPAFTGIWSKDRDISMVSSLYNQQSLNKYLGTMIISISETYLTQTFAKYGYSYDMTLICNEAGEIIAGNLGDYTLSNQAIAELCGGSFEYKELTLNGTKLIVTRCEFPSDWTMGGRQVYLLRFTPQVTVTAKFSEYANILSVMFLISAAFVLIGAYISISRLLKPLSELSAKMLSYNGRGKVYGLDTIRRDEIGDLNRSFEKMSDNIDTLIDNIKQESAFKEKYHYEALMAQLTPHFLFNTLNTIRWMALIRKADNIVHCVDALGNLLRYSMNKSGEIVALNEELTQIQSYIDIQNYRFGGCLRLSVSVAEGLMNYKVVKFVLQPIVENCVKHAFQSGGGGAINVSAREDGGKLTLTVTDNGEGISQQRIQKVLSKNAESAPPNSITGIGIHHVNTRIKFLYGEEYGISITSEPGKYTMVEFILPAIK